MCDEHSLISAASFSKFHKRARLALRHGRAAGRVHLESWGWANAENPAFYPQEMNCRRLLPGTFFARVKAAVIFAARPCKSLLVASNTPDHPQAAHTGLGVKRTRLHALITHSVGIPHKGKFSMNDWFACTSSSHTQCFLCWVESVPAAGLIEIPGMRGVRSVDYWSPCAFPDVEIQISGGTQTLFAFWCEKCNL